MRSLSVRYELAVAFMLLAVPTIAADLAAGVPVDYERDVKPLLFHKCSACHGALQQTSGLRLDAGELIRAGGDSGPAVEPGDGAASLLIERVAETDPDLRMPPEGEGEPLTADQVELLRRWIDQGARSPADEPIPEDPAKYWSYQPPVRPPVPAVRSTAWTRGPVDAFIAAKHEELGLAPRAEAPREVWLRRVFLDLIGLPPTPDELRAFLADDSADAYETVVDSLLKRPEYGERWGRHWMDVWRYSDWYGSRGGNEIRYSQRHIWRWRDWIVDSLIADKPYDQMLMEMLAGDELAPADPDVLRATGFLGRNWYKFDRNVWMFETVEQTSQAFLGLTLRCCRCHDHKYDPISQQDYYRFRAFFEPHDVRTDPLTADATREKDATLGMVLADGVPRVFDKEADAPTFLFERGDDRSPDQSQPLSPGVPAALGGTEIEIHPVSLPPEAYYPSLRPQIADGLVAIAEHKLSEAEQRLAEARGEVVRVEQSLAEAQAHTEHGEVTPVEPHTPVNSHTPGEPSAAGFRDDFATRSDMWDVISGNWAWEGGKLVETSVGNFATVATALDHPRDFRARVRYRTLHPGNYRSVGFSFDYVDPGNSQDVYTTAKDSGSAIQVFHRHDGMQTYPLEGIVETPVAVGEVVTVEITARGQQLTVLLNGQHKLDYVMPTARRDGKFALWVHQGAAEFLEVDVREWLPTLDDLRRRRDAVARQAEIAAIDVQIASAEADSVRARVAAERAKYSGQSQDVTERAATEASRAERRVAVLQAERGVMQAEQHCAAVRAAEPATGDATTAVADAGTKLGEAQQTLAAAQAALDSPDGQYAPLGDVYPSTSTGRRLALARWMVGRDNPRTARVAVNHIWLRHFGEALVPSVANFGLNGQKPSHPELLDWLAVELMENGWRMQPLHRTIVLSATYRQSSTPGAEDASQARDPENRFLWRMNSRRMEAEVVRDAVLFTAGMLDLSRGGPEIPETQGQTVLRRSLYFRNTPNEKMPFLETFDAPNPNQCYRRQESVVPHQALALMNSSLALDQSRVLAERLTESLGGEDDDRTRTAFINAAWESVLSRSPTPQELASCRQFLEQNTALVKNADQPSFPAGGQTFRRTPSPLPWQRARENLLHVLYSHNDFVTIR